MTQHPRQFLHSTCRTWHITWGTRGARLHGDGRPTVDDEHNQLGQVFLGDNPARANFEHNQMHGDPVYLTFEQRQLIQRVIPDLCVRGGWFLRTCAAGTDHVHVLLDIDRAIHGEDVRRLLKRWTTQELEKVWPKPDAGGWWARQGSNKPVTTEAYLNRAFPYVANQRAQ